MGVLKIEKNACCLSGLHILIVFLILLGAMKTNRWYSRVDIRLLLLEIKHRVYGIWNIISVLGNFQDSTLQFECSSGSLKCVEIHPQSSSIFATSGRDGNVFIYDKRDQPNGSRVELMLGKASAVAFKEIHTAKIDKRKRVHSI